MVKAKWYKGNIHTHTTESDGDESPEHVAQWFDDHDYDFLVLSDHNVRTVIEGGLEAPAAGVPVQPRTDEDFYLDPLALQPRDPRTDLGRSEIPVEFRFSNPKSIPGQTHGDNYMIRPPTNRNYGAFNTTTTER